MPEEAQQHFLVVSSPVTQKKAVAVYERFKWDTNAANQVSELPNSPNDDKFRLKVTLHNDKWNLVKPAIEAEFNRILELAGGSPEASAHACAMAIANQLGLVCDPVAGLVEIPCIKRNVAGVMIAFSSADMALAGIKAAIPVDECIDAMREVGDALPTSLKETAGGGLATTPTGLRLKEQVFGKA